ncbi:MAG: agmatinase family protein [Acidimicrobiia bacterium]
MTIVDPHWPRADVWLAQESDEPELVVVGVPSSTASLTASHADLTPFELRNRLSRFSTFHGEMDVDFSALRVRDDGNWPVSTLDMYQMPAYVRERAASLDPVPLTIFLGGDNAITRPLVAAMGTPLHRVGVITFDAHHDVRTLELGPANGTPIRGLIEEEGLPGANVVQIGIHSFANSASYRSYCHEQGIAVHTIRDVEQRGIDTVVGTALESLASRCDQIYVDVDIDVLDRAVAPACPGARPGGMTVRQLARGVEMCARHGDVRAMDLVEVDAATDQNGQTLDVMAHMLLTAAAGLSLR